MKKKWNHSFHNKRCGNRRRYNNLGVNGYYIEEEINRGFFLKLIKLIQQNEEIWLLQLGSGDGNDDYFSALLPKISVGMFDLNRWDFNPPIKKLGNLSLTYGIDGAIPTNAPSVSISPHSTERQTLNVETIKKVEAEEMKKWRRRINNKECQINTKKRKMPFFTSWYWEWLQTQELCVLEPWSNCWNLIGSQCHL